MMLYAQSPTAHRQEMIEALTELRLEILQRVLMVTAVAYGAWHLVVTVTWPGQLGYPALTLLPIVAAGELVSYRLARAGDGRAIPVFLAWAAATITAAAWLLSSWQVFVLYIPVALIATVLATPTVGLAVLGATTALMIGVGIVLPSGAVHPEQVALIAFSAFAVVLATWAVTYSLLVAVKWSLDGYGQARASVREAQDHRARLVQALRQLDIAYYRLERANAALDMARKRAEEAERSKTELVTHVSHELRTPLNLIAGFAEMMVADPENYAGVQLPAPYRSDLNIIYRSAQHLLALADDVIDLARVDVGKLPQSLEMVDLSQVVLEATELLKDYIAAKGLELRVVMPDRLPTVCCDRLRIRQVLLNLLTNAARFTERGSIGIGVSQREEDLLVEVADTGQGMSPNEMAHIFEDFHQTEKAPAGWHGGSGLGLPISKKLVELFGGQIRVDSVVGEGTRFSFALPLHSQPAASAGRRRASAARHRTPANRTLIVAGASLSAERSWPAGAERRGDRARFPPARR